MDIKHLTKADFNDAIASGTSLVDFWAGWCMPCKMLAPVIEELAGEHADITVGKVDVDAEGELAMQFGVMSIPTVVLFQDGKEVRRFVGVQPKNVYADAIAPAQADAGPDPETVNRAEAE